MTELDVFGDPISPSTSTEPFMGEGIGSTSTGATRRERLRGATARVGAAALERSLEGLARTVDRVGARMERRAAGRGGGAGGTTADRMDDAVSRASGPYRAGGSGGFFQNFMGGISGNTWMVGGGGPATGATAAAGAYQLGSAALSGGVNRIYGMYSRGVN